MVRTDTTNATLEDFPALHSKAVLLGTSCERKEEADRLIVQALESEGESGALLKKYGGYYLKTACLADSDLMKRLVAQAGKETVEG